MVGADVYLLSGCRRSAGCDGPQELLRYDSVDDSWQRLPALPGDGWHPRLQAVPGGLLALSGSDEGSERPDFRYSFGTDTWERLPDDPLPWVYDRFAIHVDGSLLVLGSPRSEPDFVNPHLGPEGGGVLDPASGTWRVFPSGPARSYDPAGLVDGDSATYEYAEGWVLDARTGQWTRIPPRPTTAYDETVAAAGRDLFVFGGQDWGAGGEGVPSPDGNATEGELVSEAWLWSPPDSPQQP